MNTITIDRIETLDGFHALKPDWDRLLGQCSFGTIFSSHDWLSVWWEVLGEGHRPYILVARRAGEVVGLAPLMQTGNRLEFMGTPNVDYADFLVAPPERPVIEAFIEHLGSIHRQFSRIQLEQISDRSTTLTCLRDILPSSGLPYHLKPLEPTYSYVYDGDPDKQGEFELTGRKWRDVRSAMNFFERNDGLELIVTQDQREIRRMLDGLFHLHIHRWAGTPTPSKFLSPLQSTLYRSLASKPELRGSLCLTWLKYGERIIATNFIFVDGNTAYLYTPAFSQYYAKRSPGTVMTYLQTEVLIRRGYLILDYTRGGEGYKSRFTNTENYNYCLTIFDSQSAGQRQLRWERFKQSTIGRKLRNNPTVMAIRIGADEYARRHGKAELVRYVAARVGQYVFDLQRFDLYRRVVDRTGKAEAPEGWKFGELSADDIELLAILYGWWADSVEHTQACHRFANGGRCFGAYSDGMLVAATWLLRQPEPVSCRALKVTLSENELLAVDSCTSPIFRDRGIQTALKQWAYAKAITEGFTIKALVPRDNKAIGAVWRKLGAEHIDSRTQWHILGQAID
jgi:CelD/BcsL family acetyltransferase involved in cellulose biosynthesis/GNAT superfamily N-acetyltransferase